jgi:hypothetical protein
MYWECSGVRSKICLLRREAADKADGVPRAAQPPPTRGNPATPRTSLASAVRALDDGDLDALTSVLWADEKDSFANAAVDALSFRVLAVRKLRQALRHKFDEDLPRGWALEATDERLVAFAAARVTFASPYFEEALVEVFGRSYRIVRDGRRWLVDAPSLFPKGPADVGAMKQRTDALADTADEITAGKFETAKEALRTLSNRLDAQPSATAQ